MPGFAGILARRLFGDEEYKIRAMLEVTLREPFYTHGIYVDPRIRAFIGYTSLESSFSDCMPIWNNDGSKVMFVSGECYVDDDMASQLRRIFPEVNLARANFLIHLYEANPERFFLNLNGRLSGVILDLKRQNAVLFNDRCGIQRIYYHQDTYAFYFASEAKSLLAVLPGSRELDPKSIGQYLTCDCVLENRTFFQNIHLLPSGSEWNWAHGQMQERRYFNWSILEEQSKLPEPEFSRELAATFDRILPRYFRGNRVALSLTGGQDTRMILSSRNPRPGELPCYTFSNSTRTTVDVHLARKAAAICQQPHQRIAYDMESFLVRFPTHLENCIYTSDGLASVDNTEVMYLNRLAREIAPVAIAGKYGSQVLKGVFGLRNTWPTPSLIHPDFLPEAEAANETLASLLEQHPLTAELTMDIPWFWAGNLALESSQVTLRSPYLDNDFLKILYCAPSCNSDFGSRFQLEFVRNHRPELARLTTDKGMMAGVNPVFAKFWRLLVRTLVRIDVAYFSERFPCRLPPFTVSLDTWLSHMGIDRLIFGHFQLVQYRQWFRDQLAEFLQDILLSCQTLNRPYWDRACLRKIVQDHIRGKANNSREIRKALQIEMLHRVLIERDWESGIPIRSAADLVSVEPSY
jgi:asparagine synthase (glutamine-hydrolysing)